MGLWGRLMQLFKIKGNKALDRVEDPRDTLDYSYEKQLDLLVEMRSGIADVATARKRIELQAQQLLTTVTKLESQALQALDQNREDLAREALTRKAALGNELADLKTQHEQLKGEEDKMVEASRRLEAKIQAFRSRKETMKANYAAAKAQTRVGEAVSGISEEMSELGRAMHRAEDKIAQMQARAGALQELTESGALENLSTPEERIQVELDLTRSKSLVESDLTRLKAQLGRADAPAIEKGESEQP